MTLWYGLDANLPNSTLKACAGIFPRRFSVFGSSDTPSADMPGRDIPTLFISDALRFYDSNIEGILITSSRPGSYYEVSLDWLGLFGSSSLSSHMEKGRFFHGSRQAGSPAFTTMPILSNIPESSMMSPSAPSSPSASTGSSLVWTALR